MAKIKEYLIQKQSMIMAVIGILMLCVICVPLLWIARYNFPAGDDFGYSACAYRLIQSGEYLKVLPAILQEVKETYFGWQGSYSGIFMMALQPGIFGEQFYGLGTWFLIGTLIFFQLYFWKRLCGDKECTYQYLFLWAICSVVQILFVPYPNETFYWFNGSVYYTFFYAVEMLFFGELIVIGQQPEQMNGRKRHILWASFLAAFLGGGNLATGMAVCLACVLVCLGNWLYGERKNRPVFGIITVVSVAAYLINVAAPGNMVRQSTGEAHLSVVKTVLISLEHAALNVWSWTDMKMILVLLLLVPVWWHLTGKSKISFRMPVLYTILSFGVYAAQLAPISYVNGSYGPCRMGNIIWYGYVVFMLLLEGYWLGWCRQRFGENKPVEAIKSRFGKYYGLFQLVCLGIWMLILLMGDFRDTSSYMAIRCIRNGEAAAYGAEIEARLEILHDASVTNPYLPAVVHRTEPLFYCDIVEDNQDFFNLSMAEYYGKETVNLLK